MQRDELRSYCERRGWQVAEEFIDEGVSGSKESRPALDRMLKAAKRRAFDAVICYRYDRMARSLKQLVNLLADFDALGIQFVSLHEGTDTSTANGRLVFGIFAALSEFERTLIIERTKSGMAAARRRGAKIGRPRVAVDTAQIRELRAGGLSWDAVAAKMEISRATAQRAVAAL
jgi:DNA invertase Pin-like site-specific DNA recombinase